MTADAVIDLVVSIKALDVLQSQRFHRAYFYHAQPLTESVKKPLGGEPVEFGKSAIFTRSQKLLKDLARAPYFSIRLGELAFRGWSVHRSKLEQPGPDLTITADDLRPEIEQKGVDMRIGMDIAALTLKRHVDTIVLVTGDSDFVPAMKFARREGAQVFLAPLGGRIRESMFEHADLVLDVPFVKS